MHGKKTKKILKKQKKNEQEFIKQQGLHRNLMVENINRRQFLEQLGSGALKLVVGGLTIEHLLNQTALAQDPAQNQPKLPDGYTLTESGLVIPSQAEFTRIRPEQNVYLFLNYHYTPSNTILGAWVINLTYCAGNPNTFFKFWSVAKTTHQKKPAFYIGTIQMGCDTTLSESITKEDVTIIEYGNVHNFYSLKRFMGG